MIEILESRDMTEEEKQKYSQKENPIKLESNKNMISIESMENLK